MSNPEPSNPSPSKWVRWLPALVFGLALFFRLLGIGWGLPDAERHWPYHPDEPVNYAYAQQISVARMDFDPGFYNYGTLYLTLLSVAGDVVSGYAGGPGQSADTLAAHMGRVILVGRVISALAGAGTALLVFLALRRFARPLAAGIGAAAIAFAPAHVVHSRFQTVDVLAAFLLTAGLYWALRLVPSLDEPEPTDRDIWKWTLLSAACIGLSTGTKYNGFLGLLALAAVLFARRPRGWLAKGLAALGLTAGVFVLTTPGIVTNPGKFWSDFGYEVRHASTGHGLVFEGVGSGFLVQLFQMLVGMGLLTVLLGLAGLVVQVRNRSIAAIAVAAVTLVFYLLIGNAEVLFVRYTFPVMIGLAFGTGWLVDHFATAPRARHFVTVLAILAVAGLPLGGGLMTTGTMTAWMMSADPRDDTAAFLRLQAQKRPGYRVGVVSDPWFYSPPLFPDAQAPRFVPLETRLALMAAAKHPAVVQYLPANPNERFDWDVRLLTEMRPEAVIFSSFEAADLDRLSKRSNLRPEVQLQVDRYKTFRARLEQDYVLAFAAGGTGTKVHDLEYIRPLMMVWHRKATP